MNQELSLWALVAEASITVQMVMFVLFMASVVSWGMIVQRALLLRRAKMQFADFEQTFWSGIDLGQLYRDGSSRLEANGQIEGVENLFRAGFKEFTRLRQQAGIESDAIMEGAQRAMRVALSREIFRAPTRHYKAGVVFLAWLNGHQDHFSMAGGLQSARGAAHFSKVFELADASGVLADPELATLRMKRYLSVACGMDA